MLDPYYMCLLIKSDISYLHYTHRFVKMCQQVLILKFISSETGSPVNVHLIQGQIYSLDTKNWEMMD